jgi:hypothetical protein
MKQTYLYDRGAKNDNYGCVNDIYADNDITIIVHEGVIHNKKKTSKGHI